MNLKVHLGALLDDTTLIATNPPNSSSINAQRLVQPPILLSAAIDDNLNAMNHILITFLVIIGAGAAVLLAYAMSYLFLSKAGMSEHEKVRLEVAAGQDFSQPIYMAEVRERNQRNIMSLSR